MKFYPLQDPINEGEASALGLSSDAEWRAFHQRDIRAVSTKGHRNPRKGEWYLSGAVPAAYRAPNDFTGENMRYDIARLVRVREVKTLTVVASM